MADRMKEKTLPCFFPGRTICALRLILLFWMFLSAPIFFGFPMYPVSAAVFAADERSPYGSSEGGDYGQKRTVSTKDEARKVLKEYFSKKDVKIENIKEKELYFEAEIKDINGKVIDVVIIDKRTGRIRSIY